MTEGESGDTLVSHGICSGCSRRFFPSGVHYAVVPHDREFLFAEIEKAFQAIRGIRVILDRRRAQRRCRRTEVRDEWRAARSDRRQSPSPIVGALPAVGGLWVSADRPLALGRGLFGGFPEPNEPSSGRGSLHPPQGP